MKNSVIIMISKNATLEDFFNDGQSSKERTNKTIQRVLDLADFSDDDWTFKNANTKEFTHAIFNEYPARMIPQIARRLIKLYYPKYSNLKDKKPILDPFAGSGTTAVEALLRNIDSITFDLNPLANLIQKVKTSIVNPKHLQKKFNEIIEIIKNNKDGFFPQYVPQKDNLEYWFSKKVIKNLTVIRYAIEQVFESNDSDNSQSQSLKDFFLLCFGKTARICSYQRLGEHKTYRIPQKKMYEFDRKTDVFKSFRSIFQEFYEAKLALYKYYTMKQFTAQCRPILGDSRKLEGIKDNSIDLIVTSPPYGDSHTTVAYGQFSRFPLEWITIDCDNVSQIDNILLGGKKRDAILNSSVTLFKTCKKILFEEILQQNSELKGHLEYLSCLEKQYLEERNIRNVNYFKEFKSEIENAIKMLTKLKNIDTLPDLLKHKGEYFERIKKVKSLWKKLQKQLLGDKDKTKKRLKIYDDRIAYILSFFMDLYSVLTRMFEVLDYDRKCCIVIGNRTVKGIKIPNDTIIIELAKEIGFRHLTTYYREIPSKRMPKRNSPTNVKGETVSTIEKESIIILNKPNI